ncbi:hypothetical protein [Paenisporosarcina antarctica]|nr:hypothetical protein [Paenisporosarcina antarctica]
MEESKIAHIDREQLQEINELENKLGVTLIAYDNLASLNNSSNETPPV